MVEMKDMIQSDTETEMKPGKITSDPMSSIEKKAVEKLQELGFISINDIIDAFKDRDDEGHLTTVVEIAIDFWDLPEEKIAYRRSKIVTIALQVTIEKAGDFTTVILNAPDYIPLDAQKVWGTLCEYGLENMRAEAENEMPVLTLTAVPMSLGGNYGMVAMDPIFWNLQPSTPDSVCNQIRLLFTPETVMFLRDNSFITDEVIAQVKSELAAEKLGAEARIRKQIEDEEFKKNKEAEIADFRQRNRKSNHSFKIHQSDRESSD